MIEHHKGQWHKGGGMIVGKWVDHERFDFCWTTARTNSFLTRAPQNYDSRVSPTLPLRPEQHSKDVSVAARKNTVVLASVNGARVGGTRVPNPYTHEICNLTAVNRTLRTKRTKTIFDELSKQDPLPDAFRNAKYMPGNELNAIPTTTRFLPVQISF